MFSDKRSKKIILVSHCILNQNTKLDECAHFPGPVWDVVKLLADRGYGIIQMPCPELLLLGLDRQVNHSNNPTVHSEDTRIAKFMKEDKAQEFCIKLTEKIIYQVEEYQKNDFEVVGLIGINGSPTCGVETTWYENEEVKGKGEFIKILAKEFEKRGIHMKMAGIKSIDPDIAVKIVMKMIED